MLSPVKISLCASFVMDEDREKYLRSKKLLDQITGGLDSNEHVV